MWYARPAGMASLSGGAGLSLPFSNKGKDGIVNPALETTLGAGVTDVENRHTSIDFLMNAGVRLEGEGSAFSFGPSIGVRTNLDCIYSLRHNSGYLRGLVDFGKTFESGENFIGTELTAGFSPQRAIETGLGFGLKLGVDHYFNEEIPNEFKAQLAIEGLFQF